MLKKLQENNLLLISILATALFYIAAHGYRFSNNMYSFDSLLTLYQNDYSWQISIGRIFIPVAIFIRGSLCNPWLISMITIVWTVLSVYFTVRILDIENPIAIILIAGVYAINPVTINMNATYIIDVDLYTLACTLAVLSVYLIKLGNDKKKIIYYFASVLSLTISLGLYQAYICMTVGLIMLYIYRMLDKKIEVKELVIKLAKMFAVTLVAAAIYYITWKLFQRIFNIWTADSYNGLSGVGDYTGTSIIGLIGSTYKAVFDFFFNPTVYQSLKFRGQSLSIITKYVMTVTNVALLCYCVYRIVKNIITNKTDLWQKLFQTVLMLLFPFGINIVNFISKGMEHTLMIYAFVLVYVLILLFFFDKNRTNKQIVIFVIPFVVFIWVNFVFANQVYLKKQLLDEAAHSMMTRIVLNVENTDGYKPGQTSVAIYGQFKDSPYIPELKDFEEITCLGMMKTNIAYYDLDYSYLQHILNVDMNLTRVDTSDEEVMKKIKDMPCYPEKGSIEYVNDTLVIKVSQ